MSTAITDVSLGTLRNNWNDYVGIKFTVGTHDLLVTHLGRWNVSGNSGTHTVKIVTNIDGGHEPPLCSADIDTSLGTAGGYQYVELEEPVTLLAGNTYFLASLEMTGGDEWYDCDTEITPSGDIVVNGAAYQSFYFYVYAPGNYAYVPPNFQYAMVGRSAGNILVCF